MCCDINKSVLKNVLFKVLIFSNLQAKQHIVHIETLYIYILPFLFIYIS